MKRIYVLLVLMLLTARLVSPSSSSAQGHLPSGLSMDAQLRTQYGPSPTSTQRNATNAAPSASSTARSNDLLIGLALMAVPLIIVGVVHVALVCKRFARERRHGQDTTNMQSPPPSVGLDPSSVTEYTSPVPLRRAKSKSVSWQSPFETKGRRSHQNTSRQSTRAASELHFVMIATPDRHTPSRYQQQPYPARSPFRARGCESGDDAIPQYRLDRLDSSPRESEDSPAARSSHDSRSLDVSRLFPHHDPTDSPIAMLQDNGEYDSDSPRVSMSSMASDDPEITRKLDDAMQWTQMQHDFDEPLECLGRPTRVMRSSSSLNDFRHDLHHASDLEDPEQITRSSEYSF